MKVLRPSVLALLCLLQVEGADLPSDAKTVSIGVSYTSFGMVSRNDASAALKAWAAIVTQERKLALNFSVRIFEQESELREAIARGEVQAASMSADEFVQSGEQPDDIFVTARGDGFKEKYVVVVRKHGAIETLADLKGRKFVRQASARTRPAWPWLQTLLAQQKLGRAETLCSEVVSLENPSKSVLRVFFRQADACLLTTNAFAVACELNPQLARELKVVAVSPPLVPAMFFFLRSCPESARKEVEQAILDLHSTPAGQQVLTVFQGTRMLRQPHSCLDLTVQVLTEYQRLEGSASTRQPVERTQASLTQ